MNLLEHYILKIYSEKEYNYHYTDDNFKRTTFHFVEVKMRINCYGDIRDVYRTFPIEEWEKVKKKMFYLE